jgi:hypothetical protein
MSESPEAPRSYTPKQKKKIIAQVEAWCDEYVLAMNSRNFDPKSPAWHSISKDFQSDPSVGDEVLAGQTLVDFLEYRAAVVAEFPTYSVRLVDISTDFDEQNGRAEVFLNLEISGVPEGVVKQNVGIMTFRDEGDKWACYRYDSFRGLGGPIMSPGCF